MANKAFWIIYSRLIILCLLFPCPLVSTLNVARARLCVVCLIPYHRILMVLILYFVRSPSYALAFGRECVRNASGSSLLYAKTARRAGDTTHDRFWPSVSTASSRKFGIELGDYFLRQLREEIDSTEKCPLIMCFSQIVFPNSEDLRHLVHFVGRDIPIVAVFRNSVGAIAGGPVRWHFALRRRIKCKPTQRMGVVESWGQGVIPCEILHGHAGNVSSEVGLLEDFVS